MINFILIGALFFYQSDTINCYCKKDIDSLYSSGKYSDVVTYKDSSFINNRDMFIIGASYLILNKFDSAFYCFLESVNKGLLFEQTHWYEQAIEQGVYKDNFEGFSSSEYYQMLLDSIENKVSICKKKQNQKLATKLLIIKEKDQFIRKINYDSIKQHDTNAYKRAYKHFIRTDFANTNKLKKIIRKNGYPNTDIVGIDGENAAWLIAQHADHDTTFQKEVLRLIYENLKKNKANFRNYPYLVDRILVNTNKKQIFGTQMQTVDGILIPQPIENEKNVDDRRFCFGLPVLQEYIDSMRNRFSK
jgi:hypothetical protein